MRRLAVLLSVLLLAPPALAEDELCRAVTDPARRYDFTTRIMAAYGAEDGQYRPPYLMRAMSALARGDLLNARLNLFYLSELDNTGEPLPSRTQGAVGRVLHQELGECLSRHARMAR